MGLVDAGSGAASLAEEAWKEAGIRGYQQFYRRCRWQGVFVSVQSYNNSTMHTNLNCKIVQRVPVM